MFADFEDRTGLRLHASDDCGDDRRFCAAGAPAGAIPFDPLRGNIRNELGESFWLRVRHHRAHLVPGGGRAVPSVWPLALLGILPFDRRRQIMILVGLVTASALWRARLTFLPGTEDHVFFGSDARANQILIGCLLAFLPMHRIAHLASRTWVVPASVLALIAVAGIPSGAASRLCAHRARRCLADCRRPRHPPHTLLDGTQDGILRRHRAVIVQYICGMRDWRSAWRTRDRAGRRIADHLPVVVIFCGYFFVFCYRRAILCA